MEWVLLIGLVLMMIANIAGTLAMLDRLER